jgi:Transposase
MLNDRKSGTEQRWRDIIKDCMESGQSIRSYCQRRGISEGSFYYWRKKLPHQTEPKLNQVIAPTFVPMRLLNPISFRVKVDCPSGHRVSIAGVDSQTLKAVFASLGGEVSC